MTVRGVNEIINRHGGSETDVVTDDVLHCIEIWKLHRPSMLTEINFHRYRRLMGVSAENWG